MELDEDWIEHINTPIKRGELATIRNSVNRQASLGQEQWQLEIATKYGMLSTLTTPPTQKPPQTPTNTILKPFFISYCKHGIN